MVSSGLMVAGIGSGFVAEKLNLIQPNSILFLFQPHASQAVTELGTGSSLFGFILQHNLLTVFIMSVLTPLTIGVLNGFATLINGFSIGFLAGVFSDRIGFFACGILPHGIIEIPAFIFAVAFTMRIGATMINPVSGRWGANMKLAVGDYMRALVIIIPMFIIAAFIEGFITPNILKAC
jgi:stage II sporulation protein M